MRHPLRRAWPQTCLAAFAWLPAQQWLRDKAQGLGCAAAGSQLIWLFGPHGAAWPSPCPTRLWRMGAFPPHIEHPSHEPPSQHHVGWALPGVMDSPLATASCVPVRCEETSPSGPLLNRTEGSRQLTSGWGRRGTC